MDTKQVHTERLVVQPKKNYTKPVISKVRMVAEEAVLGLCKFNEGVGGQANCGNDLGCEFASRS